MISIRWLDWPVDSMTPDATEKFEKLVEAQTLILDRNELLPDV
jgi:hypothetical protein